MGYCTGLVVAIIAVTTASAQLADEGLLTRVGTAETKSFYTSLWAKSLDWTEAQEFCNQFHPGMQLARIETEQERQIIYMFFVSNAASRVYYEFWLSATDWSKEGNFTWTRSGESVPFAVNQDGADGGRQENCLKVNYDARFYDESCYGWTNDQIWPLCELKRNEVTPTTTRATTTESPPAPTTPAPPTPFECKSEGTHADPLRCDGYHVCIAHQGGFIDHEFSCPQFTNFCADREMCGHPEECPCESASPDLNKYSEMMRQSQNPVGPKSSGKRSEFEVVGKVGAKTFYTDSNARNLNWIQAVEHCHQNGLAPGTMETTEERSRLLNYLGINYYVDMFWLAALDYGTEGSYYWAIDGVKVDRPIYGNGGRASNCLYLSKGGPVYDWSCDHHKSTKLWPLCQQVEN